MAIDIPQIDNTIEEYFQLIDEFFGSIKHYLGEEENSHIVLGNKISTYPLISDLIVDAIDDLENEINEYWIKHAQNVADFIKNRNILKCLYSGDITPVILENFVKKSALYVDTIILPDPLFNLAVWQKQTVINKKYYLNKLIRHVFNIWKLKELLLAKTKEKVLLILPINLQFTREEDRDRLFEIADSRFMLFINDLFGKQLKDGEAIRNFLVKFKTAEELYKAIQNPKILPNKFKEYESFANFFMEIINAIKYAAFSDKSFGEYFSLFIQSQFIRVQEHKYFCEKLIAEPIYDYDLPWFFFNYELGGLDMDAAVANVLQNEKFNWISKVPIPAIKTLREEDDLEYMRSVIRCGITDLKARHDKDLTATCIQIEENFNDAFRKQDSELIQLKDKITKTVKKDIPITTAGFLAGFIPYVGNIISLIFAGRDIKNLLADKKCMEKNITLKESNFINLLMKTYEREKD